MANSVGQDLKLRAHPENVPGENFRVGGMPNRFGRRGRSVVRSGFRTRASPHCHAGVKSGGGADGRAVGGAEDGGGLLVDGGKVTHGEAGAKRGFEKHATAGNKKHGLNFTHPPASEWTGVLRWPWGRIAEHLCLAEPNLQLLFGYVLHSTKGLGFE